MNGDWQSWVTLGVVVLTALVFAVRSMSKKKGGGCGAGCGCDKPKK
jgi:hypothetical protein